MQIPSTAQKRGRVPLVVVLEPHVRIVERVEGLFLLSYRHLSTQRGWRVCYVVLCMLHQVEVLAAQEVRSHKDALACWSTSGVDWLTELLLALIFFEPSVLLDALGLPAQVSIIIHHLRHMPAHLGRQLLVDVHGWLEVDGHLGHVVLDLVLESRVRGLSWQLDALGL